MAPALPQRLAARGAVGYRVRQGGLVGGSDRGLVLFCGGRETAPALPQRLVARGGEGYRVRQVGLVGGSDRGLVFFCGGPRWPPHSPNAGPGGRGDAGGREMKRRDFFKVITASGAAAAAAGCGRAAEQLLPHVVPNDQIVSGIPSFFATTCRECPAGCGVLARNNNGRVTKLEGNPDHPVSRGALCIRGQAALQGLYHPDRVAGPRLNGKSVSWDDGLKALAEKLTALRSGGKGKAIAFLSPLESGSLATLLDKWGEALGARPRVAYEPFAYEAIRAANRATFGRDAVPYHAFEDAAVVLSFGADFIETWISNVEYGRTFARMHSLRDKRAGTFIHVEPRQSLTAANADEWVRNAPGTEGLLALAILKVMVEENLADRAFGVAVEGVDLGKAA